MDETLFRLAEKVKNFAIMYLVDISEVPDFNKMYELYDPVTVMFFYRNKHIMIDLGTGNNNKVNWPIQDPQELVDIIETVCIFLNFNSWRYDFFWLLNIILFEELFKKLEIYNYNLCLKIIMIWYYYSGIPRRSQRPRSRGLAKRLLD